MTAALDPPTAADPSRARRPVLLFAHRGGSDGGHPQNTIAAFADALERGCSLESDVRLSADGVPVLVHDPYRLRFGTPVVIRRTSAARLARFGIPTLADIYRELGTGFELSLDLKDPAAQVATREVAGLAGSLDRLWLVHDDARLLAGIRRSDERVRLVHEARLRDLGAHGINPVGHLDALARHGITAQNTHWDDWTPELVARAHAAGVLAFGSLAQEPRHLREALARGLDGLYSDHLDALRTAARETLR